MAKNHQSDYSAKLRDPRWQKIRLEVMQRDEFTCQCCQDTTSTLNVHHFEYHGDPWNTPVELLITLCESCHEYEGLHRKQAEQRLLTAIRSKKFLSHSVDELTKGFTSVNTGRMAEVIASVISWSMSDSEIHILLYDAFFKRLNENK